MLARFKDTSILICLTFRKLRGNTARFEDISILVFLFFRKIRLTNVATTARFDFKDISILVFFERYVWQHVSKIQRYFNSHMSHFSKDTRQHSKIRFRRYINSRIPHFSKDKSGNILARFKDISILVFLSFRKICLTNVAT